MSESVFNQYESKVANVLEAKNIQNTPRTIASLLSELQYAERFSSTSEYAGKRMLKTAERIDKVLSQLASRDHKTQAESLKENELEDETLYKYALLHTFKVQKLSAFREYVRSAMSTLEKAVEKSEQRIPFSQRAKFSALLVELQGVTDDGTITDDGE